MRKSNVFAATLLAATLGLAASASAEELKVWTLTFDNDAANVAWDKIVKDFDAANPGVTISREGRSVDEHKAALRVASQSSQGPDVYFMWAGLGLGGEFVKAGLSKPLDDYYNKYDWDKRLTASAASFSKVYEGGRQGVPYTFHGEGLYYNKALFQKAGITATPTTYDELKADAAKLKKAGIPAMTFGGTVNWHLMRLMDFILEAKCGPEKHDALMTMKADWSAEACASASFTELSDWSQNYILKPFMGIDNNQAFKLFLGNRAAMMLEGDWLVGQLRTAKRMDDFDVFPLPTGADRLYGFAEYLYVSSKSAHPDDAAKFLDYLLSDKVQQDNLGAFGSISVNANVKYDKVDPLDKKWIDIFAKYSKVFVNGDQAFPLDVTTEYFRVINNVASGDIKPEDGGKTLQTFIANKG
ncbi:extracellular solute-binding protein [Rhizobium sp. VS19-DR104.2]|uniref:extracellular solute-binding protein n=1 Tax=unclassified Rhizobium TaxID=2613769 RepID=UPI001C5AC0D0|nr:MULTISPECIES: extracellular solute-binding protein [unclassified Rhizobium]MBZ5762361.1 extracellular solute-binding protein [Rhizobium sp. VS19-DR96]MBZ5769113.1 extracellular solute-binding protein [Rhizobium sp. VS19-DR129.2]MBZ5775941.1 extracellular solute-binding protein [Rhizobium sp. VS19-DRK62.2]MBZ5786295.1 extracellular solute-binding protein [Rhizobium sp. VS19-DR121]MBZ5804289.1 extracellular solute-binding protein [Rhizobium sp. VS19-DR181]